MVNTWTDCSEPSLPFCTILVGDSFHSFFILHPSTMTVLRLCTYNGTMERVVNDMYIPIAIGILVFLIFIFRQWFVCDAGCLRNNYTQVPDTYTYAKQVASC